MKKTDYLFTVGKFSNVACGPCKRHAKSKELQTQINLEHFNTFFSNLPTY
jgi:hypothetical protein